MVDRVPVFTLQKPEKWVSGVIFGSPHSGRFYPDWFLSESVLPLELLRSSEDAFVDQMIATAPALGAATLTAEFPRALVDLNRSIGELDPKVIQGTPRQPINQRTMAGLGVIPRVVSQGRSIHAHPIANAEASRRLRKYWQPYHDTLANLLAEARARFGQAILIDMHSMPHEALASLPAPRPHVVLGNRHGASSSARVIEAIAKSFQAQGLRVRRNTPFSGAHIASHYGRPAHNIHVVQVEIDRSLYMNEATITPHPDFHNFVAMISRIIQPLARLDLQAPKNRQIAAE